MRLSYANVMSTLFVVLALGGGTAIAAKQMLPKKSVGTKQLKSNAVTARKLKKNAVTRAKIRNGAVDGSKIADNSVSGVDINAGTTPFSRIVFSTRGSGSVALGPDPVAYPLANPGYTQEAGRDDSYLGAVDVTFQPGCEPPRSAFAIATINPPADLSMVTATAAAAGLVVDESGGQASRRVNLGSFQGGGSFQTSSPAARTISLYVAAECKSGSGVVATFGGVDVIGVR